MSHAEIDDVCQALYARQASGVIQPNIIVTCNLYDYYECKTQIGSNCANYLGIKQNKNQSRFTIEKKMNHTFHTIKYFCEQTEYNELQFYSYNSLYLNRN